MRLNLLAIHSINAVDSADRLAVYDYPDTYSDSILNL
jgi:hypothetical protein